MGSPISLRWLGWVLSPLLVALAVPNAALSQGLPPGSPALALERRERLSLAAGDTLLPRWQRDFMLGLARGDEVPPPGSTTAGGRVEALERASNAGDGSWTEITISPLSGHSAIYDPVRDRMVVFGGTDSHSLLRNDVWALALAGTPAWTLLTSNGTPPSARSGHSAIYDPVRDRMVVFGGYTGSSYSDEVWGLGLTGIPTWTALTPGGTPPSAKSDHTAIYDPTRDRMVVFGGYDATTRNDVRVLTLAGVPAWSVLTPTGAPPNARYSHSAIYDPMRDRMVVFGGYDASRRTMGDVVVLTLTGTPGWTTPSPAGTPPAPRAGHSAIYDPVRDRMVVFGGLDMYSSRGDAWALALAGTHAWTNLTSTDTLPNGLQGHSAIYDPARDRMVVFGASGDVPRRSETWALALTGPPSWTVLTPNGDPPGDRFRHSAIYDPLRDRMVVFGGGGGGSPYRNDVWALEFAGPPAWTTLTPAGTPPSARYGHSAICDAVRDRMVVFGGYDGFPYRNDVWALALGDPSNWTALTPSGTPPSERRFHSAIHDPVRDRMVVFGGFDGSYRNDVWALTLGGTPAWMPLTPLGTAPTGRIFHTAVYDPLRDRMVVYGGTNGSAPYHNDLNDVWELTLAGMPTWTELAPIGTPGRGRYEHTAIYDPVRDRMVLFGGNIGSFPHPNDVWALSLPGAAAWTALMPMGTPPNGRYAHSAIYDPVRDRMVIFGGAGGPHTRHDVWTLVWSDSPVPALIALVSAQAEPGRVTLTWFAPDGAHVLANVERRTMGDAWLRLGSVIPDGTGRLTFEDLEVTAGTRYAYRLTYDTGGGAVATPEVWVEVPVRTSFALEGLRPNPAVGDLVVSFSLPSAEPATLEVFDLVGRRLLTREVGSLGAGTQRLNLSPGLRLPAGVYGLRLVQGERHAVARAVVIR